ncbi:hypothetical protein D3C80_1535310 [compost metagenome]
MSPDLRHGRKIDVELVILRVGERRSFRIGLPVLRAGIRGLQDIQAFSIGGHDTVFDAIVNHLDEMPCA